MTWKFLTVCVRLYVPIDENDFMIFCRLEAVARAGAAKMGRPEAGAANKTKNSAHQSYLNPCASERR